MKTILVFLTCLGILGKNVLGLLPPGASTGGASGGASPGLSTGGASPGLSTGGASSGASTGGASGGASPGLSTGGASSGASQGLSGGGASPFKLPSSVIPLGPGGQQNQGLKLPEVTPEQKQCFQSFHDQGMQNCLQDLGSSFQTQRMTLDPTCCSFLNKVEQGCTSVIHFHNPMFQSLVQGHCGSAGASGAGAAGKAPATAGAAGISGAGGGFPNIFSDKTGAASGGALSGSPIGGALSGSPATAGGPSSLGSIFG